MFKRVAIIGTTYPSYEKYCPNWVGMQDGLARLEIGHRFFTCRPELDIAELVEFNPDLIVYGLLDMVRREDWRQEIRIRLPKAKIVLWYGDYRDSETQHLASADLSEIDLMCVSNDAQGPFYERIWRARKCLYLPLGSKIYHEAIQRRFEFPFVFIGGRYMGRGLSARATEITRFEEEGLRVIDGPGNRPDLREKVFAGMPAIYRSSKVVLDYSHYTGVPRYTSNRHWIITASGGFSLTKRFPGCELDYPEGTRAYFDTFQEALNLRDYFLGNEPARERIRAAGFEHAKNHTYDHRFKTMFEYLA